jgi:hypothetical protein
MTETGVWLFIPPEVAAKLGAQNCGRVLVTMPAGLSGPARLAAARATSREGAIALEEGDLTPLTRYELFTRVRDVAAVLEREGARLIEKEDRRGAILAWSELIAACWPDEDRERWARGEMAPREAEDRFREGAYMQLAGALEEHAGEITRFVLLGEEDLRAAGCECDDPDIIIDVRANGPLSREQAERWATLRATISEGWVAARQTRTAHCQNPECEADTIARAVAVVAVPYWQGGKVKMTKLKLDLGR